MSLRHCCISLILVILIAESCKALKFIELQQWCQVGSDLIPYNSSESVCFNCNEGTVLLPIKEAKSKVCCFDGAANVVTSRTICQKWPRNANEIACQNGNRFHAGESCDGYNHCGDGYDERTCYQECNRSFSCSISNQFQCFSMDKVCDGDKNCLEGTDEINCLYHSGRCSGYICSGLRECVNVTKICDGVKDCLDGSDERECRLSYDTSFFCNGSAGSIVPMSSVCDGKSDCSNNADEDNCYNLTHWSDWTACNCSETESKQFRKRICVKAVVTENLRVITSTLAEAPGRVVRAVSLTFNTNSCVNGCSFDFDTCYGFSFFDPSCQCGQVSMSQMRTCVCVSTTAETTTTTTAEDPLPLQWIIIIALASGILFLATVAMLYGAWYNKKAKDAMEKQVETVTSMYTHTAMSLSPIPTVTTPHSGVFFPSSPNHYRPTVRRANEPLPTTPLENVDHTYQSIEATRRRQDSSTSIDPYAQTGYNSQAGDMAGIPEEEEEGGETIVETYRNIRVSETSEGYQNTPPPVPLSGKKLEPLDKDGYLVPTPSQRKIRDEVASNAGVTYEKILSPSRSTRTKKWSPMKPPRSRFQSQRIMSSDDLDQYTSMRSMSAAGSYSGSIGSLHTIGEVNNIVAMDSTKIRRVKSHGDLLHDAKDQYTEIKKKTKNPLEEIEKQDQTQETTVVLRDFSTNGNSEKTGEQVQEPSTQSASSTEPVDESELSNEVKTEGLRLEKDLSSEENSSKLDENAGA